MFYSQYILAKKGPLGKVWLAAHFEKKLSKSQVFSTDIVYTVDTIIHPKEALSLRLSGQLMLGLIRIYSKKVNYFMVEANDLIWKIEFISNKPHLTEKIDMDMKHIEMNVNDTKFYGNISAEMEYPSFENLAFASSMFPAMIRQVGIPSSTAAAAAAVSIVSAVPDLSMMDSASSIEFIRAEDRGSFLSTSRTSLALERRQPSSMFGSATKFDDMLPTFEEKGDFSLFEEPRLPSLPEIGGIVTPPGLGPTSLLEMEAPPTDISMETPPAAVTQTVPSVSPDEQAKVMPQPKRRKIIEGTELSANIISQRLANSSPILRRHIDDKLPFSRGLSVAEVIFPTRNLAEKLFNFETFCDELRDVAYIAADQADFPFPTKTVEQPVAVKEPAAAEIARRGRATAATTTAHVPTPTESEGRMSDFGMFEPPPSMDIAFDKPYTGIEERRGTEEEGRPSLFRKFTREEGKKRPPTGSREWVRSIDNFILQNSSKQATVRFSDLCKGSNRKFAARCFLEVLQLKTTNQIQVQQQAPYCEIEISNV